MAQLASQPWHAIADIKTPKMEPGAIWTTAVCICSLMVKVLVSRFMLSTPTWTITTSPPTRIPGHSENGAPEASCFQINIETPSSFGQCGFQYGK